MSQLQNYEVNYAINVEAKGVDQLRAFGESVQKIAQARLPFNDVVGNIQKVMDGIDKVFRDKNRRRRKFDYSLKIDTKGTEERLRTISGLLDEISAKSKGVKLTIAAGKPLTARQIQANAKNIVEQNAEIAKLMGSAARTGSQSVVGTIDKLDSALNRLQTGHEVNIKTDVATGCLNELLALLGRVRSATVTGMQLGGGGRASTGFAAVPYNPAMGVYALPEGAVARIGERIAMNRALQQQRLIHTHQNTAARIRQQTQIEAAHRQRRNLQQEAKDR